MALEYVPLRVGQGILASALSEDGISIIDTIPTIYSYSKSGVYEKHAVLKGFKSYLHRYSKASAVSFDGKFALLCEMQCNKVMLFNLVSRRVVTRIELDKGPEFCVFSSDSSYFAFSNSVGRFVIYNTALCEMYHQISLIDAVSSAVFSDDMSHIAIASLNKIVYIYNMEKKEIVNSFEMQDYIEGMTYSRDNVNVVVYARSGNTCVLNVILNKMYIADPCSEWPTVLACEKNATISLLGTRSNQLHLYIRANGNKIASISLEYWGITSISIYDKQIFVGFSDGNGMIIDNTKAIADVDAALEAKDYEKLCLLVCEYPLVFSNNVVCQKIEKHYSEILNYRAQGHNEKIGFESLVSFLLSANISRSKLLKLMYSLDEISDFMASIEEAKKDVACKIAYKVPLLRQLREFAEIKSECHEEMKHQLHLLETSPSQYEEYIQNNSNTCSDCMQSVIPNAQILGESYKQMITTANAKNFAAVMDIVERYPILKQTKVFKRIINYGEAFIDKTLMMIKVGKMAEANRYATNLTRIKPFAATGVDFNRQIQSYGAFEQACKAKNAVKIFSMIEEHPVFRTTKMYKDQLVHYQENILKPATKLASLGELKKMKAVIGAYESIEHFEEKQFELYKFALVQELTKYAPIGEEQELLDKYHQYFGWDKHYEKACEVFNCRVNELVKMDDVSAEHKVLETLLSGERDARDARDARIVKEEPKTQEADQVKEEPKTQEADQVKEEPKTQEADQVKAGEDDERD